MCVCVNENEKSKSDRFSDSQGKYMNSPIFPNSRTSQSFGQCLLFCG